MSRARLLFFLVSSTLIFAAGSSAQVGKSLGLLDPNAATREQLSAIPGLSSGLVDEIFARRPFTGILAFDAFLVEKTLPREQIKELYRKIFVHIDLDSATREEILLIPGVGNKMAHEFEEYRPYRGGLLQFRKEIGKYVDKNEVARLEQYVFVRLDLNTASDEAFLSIPGLGQRMLHEFKEYRPYRSIEQFRKEIGKYVNEAEVARLERFVKVETAPK